jgi:hypothetical protein
LPSDNPTQRPTHQPTGAPTRPPTGFATTTPSRSATQFPTSSPTQARSDESDRTLTTFYVVADVPYNQVEAAQLPPQVRNLPDDAEFLLVRFPCNPYPIHNKSSKRFRTSSCRSTLETFGPPDTKTHANSTSIIMWHKSCDSHRYLCVACL